MPEAIANYLVLLGNKTPKEIFSLEEAIEFFDLSKEIINHKERLEKRRKLSKKQKEKYNKIIALISHEIKNPLSSIQGYAQMLKDEFSENNVVFINFANKIINKKEMSFILASILCIRLSFEESLSKT